MNLPCMGGRDGCEHENYTILLYTLLRTVHHTVNIIMLFTPDALQLSFDLLDRQY